MPNFRTRPDLAGLAFCGLVVVCVAVLAGLRVPIPDFLPMVGLVVAGVSGGAALNEPASGARETLPRASSTSRRTSPAPAPRSAPQHYTGPVPAAPVGSPYDQERT